jgi:hypothetical protein
MSEYRRLAFLLDVTGHADLWSADVTADSPGIEHRSDGLRRWLPDLLGIAWVLGAAGAVMLPPLVHGLSLGPYDFLSTHGLTSQPGLGVHNPKTSDQIQLFIPWTALAWTQVHQGHLPLWNPYSVLGMPLAFNWESAPFGLPALVGYLLPLRYAYTAGVLVTLVVAGTGAYFLGKVLDLGVLGCVAAATMYELSGRFLTSLGWSLGSVMSWAGWVFAFSILVVRGRRRSRDISLLAVTVALMIYAGYPEGVGLLVTALVLFLVVQLGWRLRTIGGSGSVLRPLGDLAIAGIAGCALSAPLLLPGLQTAAGSSRNTKLPVDIQTFSPHYLISFIIQGFDGLPWHGSSYFGPHTVGATLFYVGVIAIVMAVVAVRIRWRQPEIVGFAVVAVVTTALVFLSPLASIVDQLPNAGSIRLYDGLGPATFAFAVLAGVGIDVLVRSSREQVVQYWAGAGFGVMALFLLALWSFGRGHLGVEDATIRAHSFVWPAVEVALGGCVVAGFVIFSRRQPPPSSERQGWRVGRWGAILLLVCETAFLITAGAPTFSSSSTGLPHTPGVVALKKAVGSSIVGFGSSCTHAEALGIMPNVNAAYGIQEFAVYDPIVPRNYSLSWSKATATKLPRDSKNGPIENFCPVVTTARVARTYGIGFVLEHRRHPGPKGAVLDARVGDEDLYRIPGASKATLIPLTPSGRFPDAAATGTPVSVAHPGPAAWKMVTRTSTTELLRLRLTDVPGWQATIDGRPLPLDSFAKVMLQAEIPPGRHTIELHYWPSSFTAGIVLAVVAAIGLLIALVVTYLATRRLRARSN